MTREDRLEKAVVRLLDALLTYGPDYMHGQPKKTFVKYANHALGEEYLKRKKDFTPVSLKELSERYEKEEKEFYE